MNLYSVFALFIGLLAVESLLLDVNTRCAFIAIGIDVSRSIRSGIPADSNFDQSNTTGFLPDIKDALAELFTPELPCACFNTIIFTFATLAYNQTPGYVNFTDALALLPAIDYPHNPICDDPVAIQADPSNVGTVFPAQCTSDPAFFEAHKYDDTCGRRTCTQFTHSTDFCGEFPQCSFTNYQALLQAIQTQSSPQPNYIIMITDGAPTINNNDQCIGLDKGSDECVDEYCPRKGNDCTDQDDIDFGLAIRNALDPESKFITIIRDEQAGEQVLPDGTTNNDVLHQFASCRNDNDDSCPPLDPDKDGITYFQTPDYGDSFKELMANLLNVAVCVTDSPTTSPSSVGPTNSPTYKASEAPTPCCDCVTGPTPENRYIDTQSPTTFSPTRSPTSRCFNNTDCEAREDNCNICLPDQIEPGRNDTVVDGVCRQDSCLDLCWCPTCPLVFSPTPPPTPNPSRTPTTHRPTHKPINNLWLLPFLLGAGGGGGRWRPRFPNIIIDEYHVIHFGRRLLAPKACQTFLDCGTGFACEGGLCEALVDCHLNASNCDALTFCDSDGFCKLRAALFEPCNITTKPCIQPLLCFGNPNRPELGNRCASESCINCCNCPRTGGTCSPTASTPTNSRSPTRTPTTKAPQRKIHINPWLLLFLFPGSSPRPWRPGWGGRVTIDIYHVIHLRQLAVNPGAVCQLFRHSQQKWATGDYIEGVCAVPLATEEECCAFCKSDPDCDAFEFDYNQPCPDPTPKFDCRRKANITNGYPKGNLTSDLPARTSPTPGDDRTLGIMTLAPDGIVFCSTTADCWNPGLTDTDEGENRQFCSDLNGLLTAKQCLTICSADNACFRKEGIDYCWKLPNQNSQFGGCVAGGEHCICDPEQCSPANVTTPRCCHVPPICCNPTPAPIGIPE